MKQLISILLATTIGLTVLPRKVNANPAILAPSVCATGVGCILVGAVVAGGTIYYVWNNGGSKVFTDASGAVMRMLDDPEEELGVWEEPLNTRDYRVASKKCNQIKNRYRAVSATVMQDKRTKLFSCIIVGGDSR